jgi:hypothetical protein
LQRQLHDTENQIDELRRMRHDDHGDHDHCRD